MDLNRRNGKLCKVLNKSITYDKINKSNSWKLQVKGNKY